MYGTRCAVLWNFNSQFSIVPRTVRSILAFELNVENQSAKGFGRLPSSDQAQRRRDFVVTTTVTHMLHRAEIRFGISLCTRTVRYGLLKLKILPSICLRISELAQGHNLPQN